MHNGVRHSLLNLADIDWQCFGLSFALPCYSCGFTGITEKQRGKAQCTAALADLELEIGAAACAYFVFFSSLATTENKPKQNKHVSFS